MARGGPQVATGSGPAAALRGGATAAVVALGTLMLWAVLPAGFEGPLILMLVSMVAVVGIGIYSGNSGIVSFGHTALMALGAYASAMMTIAPDDKARLLPALPDAVIALHLPPVAAILGACAVVGVVALPVALLIGRLEGSSASIATLGLLLIVNGVLVGARDYTRGSQALFGLPIAVTVPVAAAFVVLAILAARAFRDSRMGLALRAARENAAAAAAVGADVVRARQAAFLLSAVIAALAGALYGHFIGVLTPRAFYFDLTFALLAILIVGGMTTIAGAALGAVLVSVLVEVLRRLADGGTFGPLTLPPVYGLTTIGLSLAILAVLYRRQGGLLPYVEPDEVLRPPARPAVPPPAPARIEAGSGELRAERLTRRFDGVIAVSEASLVLRPGEILGLIGPNGAGKSTLLSMIAGSVPPTSGRVRIDGADATGLPPHRIARRGVQRTFQNIRLFGNLSVLDNVRVAADGGPWSRAEATARAWALLDRFDLTALAARPAGTLAYGPQRRVEIARAVARAPRYLLLDEPAAGMNAAESDALLDLLEGLRRDDGIGLLVIDHDLRLILRLCDRVAVLGKGQVIAEGPPEAVSRDPLVIEAYLGRRHAGDGRGPARSAATSGAPGQKTTDQHERRRDP